MKEPTITNEARKTAQAIDYIYPATQDRERRIHLVEECVQLAINSAVEMQHKQLLELRNVADGLADKYRSEMIMMFGHAADCDCSSCTPYRTYTNFIKEGK